MKKRYCIFAVTMIVALFSTSSLLAHDPATPHCVATAGREEVSGLTAGDGGDAGGATVSSKVREELLFALSGFEYFPSRADLDKIAGAGVVAPMLIEIVEEGENPMQRVRAVDALGYYTSSQVIEFLNKLAHGPNTHTHLKLAAPMEVAMQHRAINALSKSARGKSVSYLKDLLDNPDVQIQMTVVDALGKNAGAAGRALIKEFVKQNRDPLVLGEAEKFLQ